MNLIFFSRRQGQARHLRLTHPAVLSTAGILGLGILAGVFGLGMRLGSSGLQTRTQLTELGTLRQQVQDRVDAMSIRVGELNAHMIRLDALGKRLTQMANISSGELNFDAPPALGGPEDAEGGRGAGAQIPDITRQIDDLRRKLAL